MSWRTLFGGVPPRNGADREGRVNNELLLEPRMLLSVHQQKLTALRLESGYELRSFQQLMEAPVLQVAQWVHRLPASADEHHCEPGGLLRLSIESAATAFHRAEGKFLGGSANGMMHDQERDRRLRYVAFLAGLFRPLGRGLTQVHVTAPSSESSPWNSLQEPLWTWRRRTNAQSLALRWLEPSEASTSQCASVWLASRLLPTEAMLHLQNSAALLPTLLAILGGERQGQLTTIVEEAYRAVIEVERSGRKPLPHAEPVAMPLEQQVFETLRVLCREKWTMNTERARIWCTDRGVFLDWKLAAPDVLIRLKASGLPSAPSDPDALAELMLGQHILLPNSEAGTSSPLYTIQFSARGTTRQSLEVVKLAHPEQLGLGLHGVDPIAVEVSEPGMRAEDAPVRLDPGPSIQLELVTPGGPEASAAPAVPDLPPRSAGAPIASMVESVQRTVESPLRRFGDLGVSLQRLAELLTSAPLAPSVVDTSEGLIIAYPDGVALFHPRPEQFLSACEAQGLLVPERPGGRKYVRAAPANREDLPKQYLVLAPRVVRYLGLAREAS